MVTAAIFSLLPVKPNSTIASVRIARWLSDLLGVELLDGPQIGDKELDVLFIVNGSTLFCKCLPQLAKAVSTAKQVVWIQNDYTLPPPKAESDAQSPFRKAFAARNLTPHFWTTCDENADRTQGSELVNWNSLGYTTGLHKAPLSSEAFFYYGAYRSHRVGAFNHIDRCLDNWVVSSTSKKFLSHPNAELVPPMPRAAFFNTLKDYGLGIYAQDSKSTYKNHQPATRFYEMLSVGLPMVFTPDCVLTMRQYGYDVAPYVLVDAGLRTARAHIAAEQQAWVRDFEADLKHQVRKLYDRILYQRTS